MLDDPPADSADALAAALARSGGYVAGGPAHVFFGDSSSRAGPYDRGEINSELRGDPADERCRLDPRRRRVRRLERVDGGAIFVCRRFGARAAGLAVGADDDENRPDRDHRALAHED